MTEAEHQRWLATAPASEFFAELSSQVKNQRWDGDAAVAKLIAAPPEDLGGLAAMLTELHRLLRATDVAHGVSGTRESREFDFHDIGLAAMLEAIQKRRR